VLLRIEKNALSGWRLSFDGRGSSRQTLSSEPGGFVAVPTIAAQPPDKLPRRRAATFTWSWRTAT